MANEELVKTYLRRIGMGTFVKYYDDLSKQNSADCRNAMSGEGYTKNSLNTKIASGIRLFREQMATEALILISGAANVDESVRQAASKKLRELGIVI